MTLTEWLDWQGDVAVQRMLANILPNGAVIGAPDPKMEYYQFHWLRDSSIVMREVNHLARSAPDSELPHSLDILTRFLDFSGTIAKVVSDEEALAAQKALVAKQPAKAKYIRRTPLVGIPEPRVTLDGRPDAFSWNRPQGDGPALRAIAVIEILKTAKMVWERASLSAEAGAAAERLWRQLDDAQKLIELDLDYIAQAAISQSPSVDLWEEILALHYYTHAVQGAALIAGRVWAEECGDAERARRFAAAASRLKNFLPSYWDPQAGIIRASLGRALGADREEHPEKPTKQTHLDVAVVLAAIHTEPVLGRIDERVLATAVALEDTFRRIYPINAQSEGPDGGVLGTAIGRYPGDVFPEPRGAGPWYLATTAFAELHYIKRRSLQGAVKISETNLPFFRRACERVGDDRVKLEVGQTLHGESRAGERLARALLESGDAFMRRIWQHAPKDGTLGEQFDRHDGSLIQAVNMTWTYAAFLSACRARGRVNLHSKPATVPGWA